MNIATDAPTRPALRYYGGKWKLAPWIISHFPEHKNYVEPCGGAASVLLQKPRSPLETYNDIDGNVVNFFRVLRDQNDELMRRLRLTPYAKDEYILSLLPCADDVERARRYFVMLWMSMQGGSHESAKGSWRTQTNAVHADGATRWAKPPAQFIEAIESVDDIANRFRFVQITNDDALKIIRQYGNSDALIYFDPPYVSAERSAPERYAYEWTNDMHAEASELLRTCAGYVVISGYACELYRNLYEAHGWTRVDTVAQTNSGGSRVESLWLSPRTADAIAKPAQASMFEVAA